MRLVALGLGLAGLWCVNAQAADHLVPQDNFLPDFRDFQRQVFKSVFSPDTVARAVVEPSFHREYAVAIRKDGAGYSVSYEQPETQLWRFFNQNDPKSSESIKMSRCSAKLDGVVAGHLVSAWRGMLEKTRKDESGMVGLDGTTYHFSMEADGRALTGQAWTPDPATPPGKLAGIVDDLRDYCQDHSRSKLAKANGLALTLIDR